MPLTLPLRLWHIVFRNERVWPARDLLDRDDYERYTTNLIEGEDSNEALLDKAYDPSHMHGDPRVTSIAEVFVFTEHSPWPEPYSARHLDVCGCTSILYDDHETALREIATVDEGVKACLDLRDGADPRLAELARECLDGKADAVGILADLLEDMHDPRAPLLREAHLGKPAEQLEGQAEPLLRLGHGSPVIGVAFLPGGQLLSSCHAPEMHVWDLKTGETVRRIEVEIDFNTYGVKGARSLSATRDGTLVIDRPRYDSLFHGWEMPRGRERFTFRATPMKHSSALAGAAALSTHGGFAACCYGQAVHIVDTATGRAVEDFTLKAKVTAAAFSPGDDLLAVGTEDGGLSLRNPSNGKQVRALEGHKRELLDLCFSPDGTLLASCAEDRSIRLWDVATGKQKQQFSFADVNRVEFSPDGQHLAAGTTKGIVRAWELEGGRQVMQFRASETSIMGLAFDEAGQLLATAADTSVALWEWAPGRRGDGLPVREMARGAVSYCAGLRLDLGGEVSVPA